MLREALEFIVTPGSRLARQRGYLHEIVALGARYRRHRRAWQAHVGACHEFILEACNRFSSPAAEKSAENKPRQLLIVGSGRLIEIPLAALTERFEEVTLLDLVHPWTVRRQARRYNGRVRLVEGDCTGLLARLQRPCTAQDLMTMDRADGMRPLADKRYSLAISCNILSQLPIAILHHLEHGPPRHSWNEEAGEVLGRKILTDHVRWLSGCADHACLYSDMAGHWRQNDRTVALQDSFHGLIATEPDRQWDWDIAPAPEMDPRLDLRHRVGGWFTASTMFAQPDTP